METNGTLWWLERPIEKWFSQNVGSGFTGQPALVEGKPDRKYQLVVPNATGQLAHFEVTGWHRPAAVFGVSGRVYLDVGLVWNHAGQLECVACRADVTLPPEHYINRFDNKGWVAGAPFR